MCFRSSLSITQAYWVCQSGTSFGGLAPVSVVVTCERGRALFIVGRDAQGEHMFNFDFLNLVSLYLPSMNLMDSNVVHG